MIYENDITDNTLTDTIHPDGHKLHFNTLQEDGKQVSRVLK